MPDWLIIGLTLLFLAHLVAFLRLAWNRGGGYYWLVSAVFLALTGSFGLRWYQPDWAVLGLEGHLWLRYLAWSLAAITLPWLLLRLRQRRPREQGSNLSR